MKKMIKTLKCLMNKHDYKQFMEIQKHIEGDQYLIVSLKECTRCDKRTWVTETLHD